MKLYLIRHAEAIERNSAVREEDRWLTPAAGKKGDCSRLHCHKSPGPGGSDCRHIRRCLGFRG